LGGAQAEVLGTEVPQWGPGAEPLAAQMLRHEAKKPLMERKNKSIQTDIV